MSNILKTLKVPERKSQTKYKEYLAKKKEKEIDRFGTPWNLSWKYWLLFIVIIALYFLISNCWNQSVEKDDIIALLKKKGGIRNVMCDEDNHAYV